MYLDANNLYGHAQSQMLPVSNFSFLTAKETVEFDCHDIDDNSPYGYIMEVDLDYPAELHNDHNDYPLAPKHLAIRREMLSPCQLDMLKTLGIKPPTGSASCVKLIPNLYSKKNYVVHYRNLKFYLQQGLALTKIHRVLHFVQSAWLTPYVEFNTKRRQEAKSPFERNFFKLLINLLFGKLMQNLRGQSNAKIVIDASEARRFIAKPTFKSCQIVSEDVVIVSMGKGMFFTIVRFMAVLQCWNYPSCTCTSFITTIWRNCMVRELSYCSPILTHFVTLYVPMMSTRTCLCIRNRIYSSVQFYLLFLLFYFEIQT